jgi:3-deoxy-D-manno-octulosonic-acid transferase
LGAGAQTIVAGSTWPGDESILLDGLARLYVRRPDIRLILVPHEPTEPHLSAIIAEASRLGLPAPKRLSQLAAAEAPGPLLLVDRVGVLAALYGAATMAYVGGGFHRPGLHSVLEPAAWGIPVVFGPRWTESRDAGLLLQAGGAVAISELGTTEAGEGLQEIWEDWIRDDRRRRGQGAQARSVVEAGVGAADRLAGALERLVRRR